MAAHEKAAAAAVPQTKARRERSQVGRLRFGELLNALDHRIDRLNREYDQVARLRQGAELLTAVFSFCEELTGCVWSIRGALGLEQAVE